jgi:CHASE3 domain sensor protein
MPEPMFPTTAQIRYAKFDELGETEVRERLQTGRITGQKELYAKAWLARFDDERRAEKERLVDATQAEQLAAAISAKDAAWEAARAAREQARLAGNANIIATLALITAAIAITVSVLTAFLS